MAPTFFPIAVWGSYAHEVANVAEDKAVGINTYVWVADQSAGVHAQHSERRAARDSRPSSAGEHSAAETAGWLLDDEVRHADRRLDLPVAQRTAVKASIGRADGRFYYSNYGKGVIFWETDAQAACCVNYDDVELGGHLLVHGRERVHVIV